MKRSLVFILIFILLSPLNVYANSAEPPSIVIMCMDGPDDLEIYYGDVKLSKNQRIGEDFFSLYRSDFKNEKNHVLKFVSDKKTFEIEIVKLDKYRSYYRLDYSKEKLSEGKGVVRSSVLIAIRILLTLIVEAAVFFVFGFRSKKSWRAFLLINLLTQGSLNIWLSTMTPGYGYIILALIFSEVLILLVESLGLSWYIDELATKYTVVTVIVANLISFYVGMMVIPLLPI
ncbi:hypothetical protein EZV73_21420 [Acidaminobacter sp. JC074]|uniref:hypothetical protein n=1 Tax=Acidaminobacter sp. JC074 TaxID=2530199 RepID=UPI001F10D84D|nr:hypothetical protein [Acidaminobacter sp. JC074]MCH4890155.1 hypothetical protein [Acidaminobacter sp. JC074]